MNKKTLFKIVVSILSLAFVFFLFRWLNLSEYLNQFVEWVPTLGVWAPIIFVIVYIVCAVLFVPASALTLGAGAIFGLMKGTLLVSFASVSAAVISFLIGRYFARNWIAKKVDSNARFQAIDNAVGREGWKIVGLTRLSPVFPFGLLNYGYGITKVSLKDYFWASWIGMLPGTIMYVYLGAVAGTLATSGAERERTSAEWALLVVGLMATIAVTIYITKIAKKSIDRKLDDK